MATKTTRGYGWGRRLIMAATLALTSAVLLAAEAGAKYIWKVP